MSRSRWSSPSLILVALMLVAGLLAGVAPAAAAQANITLDDDPHSGSGVGNAPPLSVPRKRSPNAAGPLDLPAMPLLPPDLEAEGLEGYGLTPAYATFLTPDYLVPSISDNLGKPDQEVADALEAAGLERSYGQALQEPTDPGNPDSGFAGWIDLTIHEFADSNGAEDALAFFADVEPGGEKRLIDGAEGIGDESFARVEHGEDEFGAYFEIDVTVLIDNLLVKVAYSNVDTGEDPEEYLPLIQALAERQAERVEAVLDGEAPGLSKLVLHLEGDGVTPLSQRYIVLDGDRTLLFNESAEDAAQSAASMGDVVAAYSHGQAIAGAESGSENDTEYYSVLYRLPDEDAAVDWLASRADNLADDESITDLVVLDDAPMFGDESVTLTAILPNGGQIYVIYARVGDTVARVHLFASDLPPAEAVEELAAGQVACLEAGACPDPVPVPAALNESGPNNRQPADEKAEERAEASVTGGVHYENPTYGFNFDADETWTLAEETSSNGQDLLQFDRTRSTLYVQSYPFDGDAADCIEASVDQYLDDPAYSDLTQLEDAAGDLIMGSDFIHAYVAFTGDYTAADGATTPVAVYVECWQVHVGPNAVARFLLHSAPEDFPDEYAALQELLTTLRV